MSFWCGFQLLNKIRQCWDSIKSERVAAYTKEGLTDEQMAVAVIVESMVESQVSGVIFTANPVSSNRNEIMIEAIFGLGELLVQGAITPDNFLIDKSSFEIKERDIQSKDKMIVFENGRNKEIAVPANRRTKPALDDKKVKELAELALKIEEHYNFPQDIEYSIDGEGKIWILQSRPITTLQTLPEMSGG